MFVLRMMLVIKFLMVFNVYFKLKNKVSTNSCPQANSVCFCCIYPLVAIKGSGSKDLILFRLSEKAIISL